MYSQKNHITLLKRLVKKNNQKFKHTESGKSVTLGYGYVQDLLNTSDQYDKRSKSD